MDSLHVIDHALARVLLTTARDKETQPKDFAELLRRLGHFLAVDVLRGLQTVEREVTTPLDVTAKGRALSGRVALVPVLRAGGILEEGFRAALGNPYVWHLGLRRDEDTLKASCYLNRIPDRPPQHLQRVVILEVMLATGGSACDAIDVLKNRGYTNITFVCVIAAPEGIARVQREHPDVEIWTLAVDERLTSKDDAFPSGYIVPGCGDAGDRINDTLAEALDVRGVI